MKFQRVLFFVLGVSAFSLSANSGFKAPDDFYNIPASHACDKNNPHYSSGIPVNAENERDAVRYNAWRLFVGINANFSDPKSLGRSNNYIPRWGTWLRMDDIRNVNQSYQTLSPFCAVSTKAIYSVNNITLPTSLCEATKITHPMQGNKENNYRRNLTAWLENHWADLPIKRQYRDNRWTCNNECLSKELALNGLFNNPRLKGGLLLDRHESEVLYEVRLNPVINQSYLSQVQRQQQSAYFFPQGTCYKGDYWYDNIHPSIAIKIAWKVVNQYDHKADFLVLENISLSHKQQPVALAMVAMHIVVKEVGYTNWRWLTFEHKNTVKKVDGNAPLFAYSDANIKFHNAYITRQENMASVEYSDVVSPILTRLTPIQKKVKTLNSHFQQWLTSQDSVLANYELVDVQFTAKQQNHSVNGQMYAADLRNTVLEAYVTPSIAPQCQNPNQVAINQKNVQNTDPANLYYQCNKTAPKGGCLGCHRHASGKDFVFAISALKHNGLQPD